MDYRSRIYSQNTKTTGARRPVWGRNRIAVSLHITWTTAKRMPLVTPELERALYRCISAEVDRLGCHVLAINGMPDHVHVVLYFSATTSIANLVKQMKGVSSSLAREILGPDTFFQWADGYAVFSLSPAHRKNAIAYVERQKEHHTNQTTRPAWEQTTEDDIPKP